MAFKNFDRTISFRCSSEQLKIWRENANKAGVPLNRYLRIAANYTAKKVSPADFPKELNEIAVEFKKAK